MNDLTTTAPIVTLKNGQAFANSRDVAAFFGRLHKNVLRGIEALECSAEFARLNFEPCSTPHPTIPGRTITSYDMTKDGFTFLVMGYTGSLAARFKELYIAAFNELEAKAVAQATAIPNFNDPVAAARAWADQMEQRQIAQAQVEELKPLAVVGAKAVAHVHSLNRFVRTLPGVNSMKVKQDLLAMNYLRKSGGTYRVYARFSHLFTERLDESYGTVDIFPTPAGKALLVDLYNSGRLTMKVGYVPA